MVKRKVHRGAKWNESRWRNTHLPLSSKGRGEKKRNVEARGSIGTTEFIDGILFLFTSCPSLYVTYIFFFFVLRSTRSENGSAEEHQRSVSLNFGCNSLEIQRRPFYCSCKNKGWEKKGNGGKKEERGDWREVCVQRKNARKSADFTMRLDRR